MRGLLSRLDRTTRMYWRLVGRPVDLAGAQRWLAAPTSATADVGDRWLRDTLAAPGATTPDGNVAGLLADMSQLDGPGFTAADLRQEIRQFYEHTAQWRMEAWARWNPLFQPGGELITRLFGRRVQQLALPTRPLDMAHGVDSHVVPISDGDGYAAGWLRTLRSTGEYVFSGYYSTARLPGSARPSVHVAFPLEAGNVQVFLRPHVLPGGALQLSSPRGSFGQDGAYVVVTDDGRAHAARVPVHETFHVYVDGESVLRADHFLALWSARVVHIHYKLQPAD